MHLIAVEKLRQSSFFGIYSYFKDSAFTVVKRVNAKFLTWYVKEVPFVNRRYTNGLPFLSKMVYKMGLGLDLGPEPEPEPVENFVEFPALGRQAPVNRSTRHAL